LKLALQETLAKPIGSLRIAPRLAKETFRHSDFESDRKAFPSRILAGE